jgi:hypothetical protein
MKSAPLLALDSGHRDAGEIVDPDWESRFGHAVAAARYGALTRPEASEEPKSSRPLDDPRAEALRLSCQAEREAEEEAELEISLYA